MKKILLFALPVLVLALGACSKNSSNSSSNRGSASFNGKTYSIGIGSMDYYGTTGQRQTDQNTASVGLLLASAGFGVYFDMNVAKPEQRLVAGTYVFGDSFAPLTFSEGAAIVVNNQNVENTYYISAGTVTVSLLGTTHTVVFNCIADGKPLTGTYTGTLVWSD